MNSTLLVQELQFKAVRSSGAGGQHVNKVATKIELSFDVKTSEGLSEWEKERITSKLRSRLTKQDVLLLQCGESRSQHKNKALVIKRFLKILDEALQVPKKRKKTKPSRAAIEKRLKAKKKASHKKTNRATPDID